MEYTAENTFALAKRVNNKKRSYLLVNPLQAKHIPVSPTVSLEMMRALGKKLAEKYPDTKLVIGFAETATAIAAAAAECFGKDCVYIHTTREPEESCGDWVYFSEEHSHASEQKLCAEGLGERIENTSRIILIDDELSTGKTLINIVNCLKNTFPQVENREIIAASVINRLSEENTRRLKSAGITPEYLVKLSDDDLSEEAEKFTVSEAVPPVDKYAEYGIISMAHKLPNPRRGVNIADYRAGCAAFAAELAEKLDFADKSRVLVLGTEECMYPALIFGRELENAFPGITVKCHATTRSPIGISTQPGYPIRGGYRLRSFYDENRETYIYNTAAYDTAVVITDSAHIGDGACRDLAGAFGDCGKVYIAGGN